MHADKVAVTKRTSSLSMRLIQLVSVAVISKYFLTVPVLVLVKYVFPKQAEAAGLATFGTCNDLGYDHAQYLVFGSPRRDASRRFHLTKLTS